MALQHVRVFGHYAHQLRGDHAAALAAFDSAGGLALAGLGRRDGALGEARWIRQIERLLAGPSWLSVHTLRLDPLWDPIREHPRFKTLLAKYGGQAAR